MNPAIQFGRPNEVTAIMLGMQSQLDPLENEWHVLANLFNPDRIDWADEAVVVRNHEHAIVSIALICKANPFIVSYYTASTHRRLGYGYLLLQTCVRRIAQAMPGISIGIEPTSEGVLNQIAKLPEELRTKLRFH